LTLRASPRSTISSYNLTSTIFTAAQPAGYAVEVFSDMVRGPVAAKLVDLFFVAATNATSHESGIGVDTTLAFSGTNASVNIDTTGQDIGFQTTCYLTLPPFAGFHTLNAIERMNGGAGTCSVFVEPRETVLQADWSY
jgi:hypothetical protein